MGIPLGKGFPINPFSLHQNYCLEKIKTKYQYAGTLKAIHNLLVITTLKSAQTTKLPFYQGNTFVKYIKYLKEIIGLHLDLVLPILYLEKDRTKINKEQVERAETKAKPEDIHTIFCNDTIHAI